jgi:hypothetical protein
LAENAQCAKCGREDFLMLSSVGSEYLRLCKKCYDGEIDEKLVARAVRK